MEPLLKDRTLIVNGVSKGYAMTGWRIGYGVANETLINAIRIVQSQATSNPCSISQEAALEALNGDQSFINAMLTEFEIRRNFVVKELKKIDKLKIFAPDGAFYVFFSIENFINDKIKNCSDFCDILLEKHQVASVPGVAFGCENCVRISFASSMEKLEEGVRRISQFVLDS